MVDVSIHFIAIVIVENHNSVENGRKKRVKEKKKKIVYTCVQQLTENEGQSAASRPGPLFRNQDTTGNALHRMNNHNCNNNDNIIVIVIIIAAALSSRFRFFVFASFHFFNHKKNIIETANREPRGARQRAKRVDYISLVHRITTLVRFIFYVFFSSECPSDRPCVAHVGRTCAMHLRTGARPHPGRVHLGRRTKHFNY